MATDERTGGDVGSLFPVPDESALPEPTEHLDAADREMIAVVVSAANRCLYCLVAHGAALREALGDPVLGERIAFDWRRARRASRFNRGRFLLELHPGQLREPAGLSRGAKGVRPPPPDRIVW